MILAFDTSLPFLSVALTGDDRLIGSVILEGRLSRNEKLLPVVDWLMTESGKPRTEIELIPVRGGFDVSEGLPVFATIYAPSSLPTRSNVDALRELSRLSARPECTRTPQCPKAPPSSTDARSPGYRR